MAGTGGTVPADRVKRREKVCGAVVSRSTWWDVNYERGVSMRFLLFETWIGEWLLGLIERWFGLAVVPVDLVSSIRMATTETAGSQG